MHLCVSVNNIICLRPPVRRVKLDRFLSHSQSSGDLVYCAADEFRLACFHVDMLVAGCSRSWKD